MFNLVSLGLGLVAWFLGVWSMVMRGCPRRSFWSFTCCAGALVSQLFEIRRRVEIGDLSAIMDTIGAVCFAAVVLVAVTVLVNGIALGRMRRG